MGIFVALLMGLMVANIAKGIDDDCCPEKEVGGVIYNLVALDPAAIKPPFNCKNSCVYISEKDGNRYCFAIGKEETECIAPLLPLGLGGQDGVLMMGGYVNAANCSDNVNILGLCPFFLTKSLPVGVQYAAAAMGKESEVFVCGGMIYDGSSINDCFIRDNSTGNWNNGAQMRTKRNGLTLNRVGSNLVAVGGWAVNGRVNTYEVLDLDLNSKNPTWQQLMNYTMSTVRDSHCAVTISSSELMIIGGYGGGILNSVEILDIYTGKSVPAKPMVEAVYGHQCTIYNGMIWLTGGNNTFLSDRVYSLYYSENPSKSPWILRGSMNHARFYHVAAVINGALTVYSGSSVSDAGYDYQEIRSNDSWLVTKLNDSDRRVFSAYVPVC